MKVLIVGSNGALGTEFVKLYADHQVTAWDRSELDITDADQVASKVVELNPELIINCAAYNAVDKAEAEETELANKINGYAVGYLADAANQVGATLVHFSTNYVFDGNDSKGYTEDSEPHPISQYGNSKFLGETQGKRAQKFYLIRTAWLFGGVNAQGKKSFIDLMSEKALGIEELKLVNDEFGNPTYVVDLAQATRALIETGKPPGIYHLVNEGSAAWADWAREIFKIKNLNPKTVDVSSKEFKRPALRPQYGILNNTKFIQLRPWQESLEEYLNRNK